MDRIEIRGYVPGLQYLGGVVRFLLNRGNFIPWPAALNHKHERLCPNKGSVSQLRKRPYRGGAEDRG